MNDLQAAQDDMNLAYFGGGPGMLASGLVWLTAALVGLQLTVKASALTLFFGGMLIFPLAILIAKLLNRSGQHQKGNPLAPLAMESTVLLFIGLFIAFVVLQSHAELFFPIMLLTIGGRYLVFQSLYGMRIYWLIGGVLAVAGMLCILLKAPIIMGAFVGAGIEIVGAFWVMKLAKTF